MQVEISGKRIEEACFQTTHEDDTEKCFDNIIVNDLNREEEKKEIESLSDFGSFSCDSDLISSDDLNDCQR